MLPVITLVGRPNVGKSTLFNFLTRSRDALVADMPGLTRDRQYGFGRVGARPYLVVDTGGLGGNTDGLEGLVARQSMRAIDEADAVLFMVDARSGLTTADEAIADHLRRSDRRVWVAANKAEGMDAGVASAEFHTLGLGPVHAISSTHGDRVEALLDALLGGLPAAGGEQGVEDAGVRIAIAGRPNVGKSTLANRLLGDDRMLTFDEPGTTRDAVEVPFVREGVPYTLVDTAGIRRRSRVDDALEKFSVIKTMQAIERANVVIAVLDARGGIVEQDATLLGLIVERGRALVIAVNKWDGLDEDLRDRARRELDLKLPFLDFTRVHYISALHGSGLGELFESVQAAYRAAVIDLATPALSRVLERAVQRHQPPLAGGRRIKLRYAHQGGRNPPVIVIHGNRAELTPAPYRRYLANTFRDAFDLWGTPVRVELRSGRNPYSKRS